MIVLALHDVITLTVRGADATTDWDQTDVIKELARRFDAEQAAEKISECYRMLHWIESNVNEKLIFEQLLLNLADSDTMPAGR